jgi:aryl-alcohol dehydrogenase-like predicted oxidoreductase
MDDNDPNASDNGHRHIIEQCEACLRRLQTDYIDLYQIHRPSSNNPIDETLRALEDLVHSGKVRFIGTSTFAAWQVMESLWVSKEQGLNRFVSEQPPYHLLDRRIERELVPMAITYGIGLIPWSPLAGGFLTGKYQRGQDRLQDARFSEKNEWTDRHFIDRAFDVLELVEQLRVKRTVPLASLPWHGAPSSPASPALSSVHGRWSSLRITLAL